MKVWRDDDIGANHVNNNGAMIPGTRFDDLRAVDDVFQRYGVPHTIAVMACGLKQRDDLIDLIRQRGMVVQLHCWKHDDLTLSAKGRDQLKMAVDTLVELTGQRPTVLYPPWNRSNEQVHEVAARLGLSVSSRKASLDQFVRVLGDLSEDTINFHHWHVPDVVLLERALSIATAQ